MAGRSRSVGAPPAEITPTPTPTSTLLEARRSLDKASRLQRNGDLVGAIRTCQEGIALVAEAEDTDAIQLRVSLRQQKESASRQVRDATAREAEKTP